ncbi:MAG TPA: hypothetical protein VHC97_18460 [Thermoanaerobaculia bacterium]|jgi:hypothetical protein|nr:hypothetical protein [Thermoanaerobaculia bacterium]
MDLDLTGRQRDDPVPGYAQRLQPTARLCAALAGVVALLAVLCWLLVHEAGGRPWPGIPYTVPLVLAMLSAMLILLSSRFRSSMLRRAFPRSAELAVNPDVVLAAYRRATLASFMILEASAVLGLLVALTSGSATYGIVLCAVAAFGMLTRWPRGTEVDRLVRGRARP